MPGADFRIAPQDGLISCDSGCLDPGCGNADLNFDMGVELGRRHDDWLDAERRKLLAHLWRLQGFQRFAVKLVNDFARRVCREKRSTSLASGYYCTAGRGGQVFALARARWICIDLAAASAKRTAAAPLEPTAALSGKNAVTFLSADRKTR